MRKILMLAMLFSLSPMMAQEEIEDLSYSSESVIDKNIGLPIVRSIYGGTKIIPEFEGNWPYEMKGAFKLACEIWEEALPTTFPIRIKAVWDENTSKYANQSIFSNVRFKVKNCSREAVDHHVLTPRSPWTQMKAVLWLELAYKLAGLFNERVTPNMFMEPEITITYYNYNHNLENLCSCSLDGTVDQEHYDFVTMALRDIAKSFGLVWSSKKIRVPEKLNIPASPTPFETHVLMSLGANPTVAYKKATMGNPVLVNTEEGYNISLYAPSVWDEERSLNYFIPTSSKKISELLSYQFGKGTVVRDIASDDTYRMFSCLLNWTGLVAVGIGNEGNSCGEKVSSTNNILPFKGAFSLNHTAKAMSINSYSKTDGLLDEDSLRNYVDQFIPKSNRPFIGFEVFFLKNDGTWDNVYYEPGLESFDEINVNEFQPHYDIDSYARSCDGYLRCRVVRYANGAHKVEGTAYYFLLDYLPQRVELARSATIKQKDEDEYLREVKVGLNNLEGVTKVVVSQLDEDNEMPYLYEVKDFKKGYFIATVDKDFSTTFTITAYNKNGSTTSYPYTLAPLDPSPINVEFRYNSKEISIIASNRRNSGNNLIANMNITPLLPVGGVIGKQALTIGNKVEVSSLPKGSYVLNVYDIYNKKHTFKFIK
ncbi:hypothetical protein DW026_12855 [Segatella copri]|jgi:uncharacterized protein YxeA|uniref:T9SS type A sorting domain-containing protein n=2 Tax=Segatella copri TaxID=165179 RepID=A0AA92VB00_9BACT|nr:hypothetical protein [Segatella copri]RHL34409.1 hypothetical protein DW026_12855 [Segatella copri]